MRRQLSNLSAQRGAAILTAMLTVVLVATLAASTLWQQWRNVEIETAQRARTQATWVLSGALDWARLILREDARRGGADHLAEPWAVPLESARLSTFLAADRSDALEADEMQQAFLSGQITDLQARLNVVNLVESGKVHEPSRLALARLFELLNLPDSELTALLENLRQAQGLSTEGVGNATAAPSGNAPLWPQSVDQLAWLGLSASTLERLRPFIAVLPVRTPVNLNTAPAEVLYACVEAFSLADARRLVSERSAKHLTSINEAAQTSGQNNAQFNPAQHSVASRFFEVRGTLRMEQTVVQELSVVQRDGLSVSVLARQRSVERAKVASLQ